MNQPIEDRRVTVCSECLHASCWHGAFMCEKARSAGTVQKSVGELHLLKVKYGDDWENPEYWFRDPATGAIDQQALTDYRAAYVS